MYVALELELEQTLRKRFGGHIPSSHGKLDFEFNLGTFSVSPLRLWIPISDQWFRMTTEKTRLR